MALLSPPSPPSPPPSDRRPMGRWWIQNPPSTIISIIKFLSTLCQKDFKLRDLPAMPIHILTFPPPPSHLPPLFILSFFRCSIYLPFAPCISVLSYFLSSCTPPAPCFFNWFFNFSFLLISLCLMSYLFRFFLSMRPPYISTCYVVPSRVLPL